MYTYVYVCMWLFYIFDKCQEPECVTALYFKLTAVAGHVNFPYRINEHMNFDY